MCHRSELLFRINIALLYKWTHENAMTGSAVSTATATQSTVKEIGKIAGIAVAFVLLVLVITTDSWLEPVLC